RPARELTDPFQVTAGQRVAFLGLTESLGGVLTDGFEEPKTSTRTSRNPRQDRAFDELFEEVDHPTTRDPVVSDDGFSGVDAKTSGEDPHPSEHAPFVVVEEAVAPVERGSQGAMTLGRCSPASSEDRELFVEPVGELGD